VPARNDAYFQGLVENELRSLGYTEPPVSIDAVADHLGVPVFSYELPPWFTAALIYEDGLPVVLMNARKDPGVRRRAIGHLIGHLLILMNDMSANYPRDSQAKHVEAEMMADEFETPAYMVRDQAQKWFNDYGYLAGLFGVTEDKMFERMRDLGLIKSHGVLWDY
jgi:Zn-dependent peptidase ImmA (M78 family)